MMTKNGHRQRKEIAIIIGVTIIVALAGCSGISDVDTKTPTATSTSTSSPKTDTITPTVTSTPTPELTRSKTQKPSQSAKQRLFTSNYSTALEENRVNVTNTTVDGENETLYLTYRMKNPKSDRVTGDEEENVSLMYAVIANGYINKGFNESWIPKQVNVTAVAPDGYVFEKGYLKYEWAEKLRNDEIDAFRYMAEYYNTTECGPKYPECE